MLFTLVDGWPPLSSSKLLELCFLFSVDLDCIDTVVLSCVVAVDFESK